MMVKGFLSYGLSSRMKFLGFNEPCLGYFDCERDFHLSSTKTKFLECEIPRPTVSQAFGWFREKFGYLSFIDMDNYSYYRFNIYKGKGVSEAPFETYEEAESACLEKLIRILEEEK
jgi:hypothetical protein